MSDFKYKILVILGTARKGRYSERVWKAIVGELQKRPNLEIMPIDVRDYIFGESINGSEDDPRIRPWKELVTKSDGLFIVTPEYNHSYPGELKMLIDEAFDEYEKKPVAICGVSDGGFGGARMIEMLRGLLAYLQMLPVPTNITVSKVDKTFDENNQTADENFYKKVNKAADEIVAWAELLRSRK